MVLRKLTMCTAVAASFALPVSTPEPDGVAITKSKFDVGRDLKRSAKPTFGGNLCPATKEGFAVSSSGRVGLKCFNPGTTIRCVYDYEQCKTDPNVYVYKTEFVCEPARITQWKLVQHALKCPRPEILPGDSYDAQDVADDTSNVEEEASIVGGGGGSVIANVPNNGESVIAGQEPMQQPVAVVQPVAVPKSISLAQSVESAQSAEVE